MKRQIRFELFVYFISVLLLTWLCWIPFVLNTSSAKSIYESSDSSQSPLMALQLIGNIVPTVLGLFLLRYFRPTQNRLNTKPKFWVKGTQMKYIILAILIPVLIYVPGAFLNIESKYISQINIQLIITTIFSMTIIAGVGEEFGWRGFALPRLLEMTTPLKASLILNIIWAFWHLPIHIWTFQSNTSSLSAQLISAWLVLIGIGLIMTYIFLKTRGNLALMVLFHGMITGLSALILPIIPNSFAMVLLPLIVSIVGVYLTYCIVIGCKKDS